MQPLSNATSFAARGVTSSSSGPAQPASPDAVMDPVYSTLSALSLQEPLRPRQEPAPRAISGLRIRIPLTNPATRTVLRFNDSGLTRSSGPAVRERSPRAASPQSPGTGSAALADWPTLAEIGRRARADDDHPVRSDRSRSPSPETKDSRASAPWTDDEPSSPPLIVRESDILQLRDWPSPIRKG